MKKLLLIFLLGIFSITASLAQNTSIKGSVIDAVTNEPVPDATVTIEETNQSVLTNASGEFIFSSNVPLGEQMLRISKNGYISNRYPIVVNEGQTVNITDMTLDMDVNDQADLFIITLSDDELSSDENAADNTSGLLQSSRDIFANVAAFEFSNAFFRLRGLDSENGTVLINGVKMNKLFNGRPQWSNWGGMNDVMRNQEFAYGMLPLDQNFGGLTGTTNISTRASSYRSGGRVSYAASNRSYNGRLLASYNTGMMKDGWAFSLSVGRRWADQAFVDGTLYDSNSFFASIEKKINDKHSLNFTSIYAQNRRGRSSSNTQEIFDLKGIKYNSFWGYQDGAIRNSRVRNIEEPIVMLGHYWKMSDKTQLNTNVSYQFGKIGNSRLDYGGKTAFSTSEGDTYYSGGGFNPDPAYYQKLPSFFLSFDDPNFQEAYTRQQEFINDGQIDWNSLYSANQTNAANGRNSAYIVYEDRNDDKTLTFNTILNTELADNITFDAAINYQQLKSENFANVLDLLGGTGYLDVDSFADNPDDAQSDINNPNFIAQEGDKIRYNFELDADVIDVFAKAKFQYNKVDFYLAANAGKTSYQRNGLFQNGNFKDNSFGKSEKQDFSSYGAKLGATLKVTGRHLIDANAALLQRAPSLRNTFSNSRQNNNVVIGLEEEKITGADLSYIYRSPIIKSRLTGYYYDSKNGTDISFFFVDGIGGDQSSFVQEILTNVGKQNIGMELGIEAQVTPTIKLKGAASIGQFTYSNNPNLALTSEDFDRIDLGQSTLKDYKIAGGPQRAFSAGFEYRDPDYWWIGVSGNYFSNTYIDVSPLLRSSNFSTDVDGLPFSDYDPNIARELLRQEEFDDYYLVNLVGGKSWKIGDYFVGFFASVNNVLNQEYKTGGFEQARNGNYRELLDESQNDTPVFGSRYWYGRGTTYYMNVYFRF